MGRFDVLIKNTEQKSNRGNRRPNNSKDGDRIRNLKSNNSNSNDLRNNINITQDEFPELSSTLTKKKEPLPWMDVIKQQEEVNSNENIINQHDPKYWNGVNWIGPMFMRQKKSPKSNTQITCIKNTIPQSQVSCIIVPYCGSEYSRDGINWYASWNETFTNEQLSRIYEEDECNIRQEQANILEEYRLKEYNNSTKYYEETGELDDCAVARLQRLTYEKYTEQFEFIDEVSEIEYEEEVDDYLEDDY